MSLDRQIIDRFNANSWTDPKSPRFFQKLDAGYSMQDVAGRTEEEANSRLVLPPDVLKVLTKIYYKKYPDVGRKRGALIRWVKELKEKHEEQIPMDLKILEQWMFKQTRR